MLGVLPDIVKITVNGYNVRNHKRVFYRKFEYG